MGGACSGAMKNKTGNKIKHKEEDAIERLGERGMYNTAAGVTRHTVLQQSAFL